VKDNSIDTIDPTTDACGNTLIQISH